MIKVGDVVKIKIRTRYGNFLSLKSLKDNGKLAKVIYVNPQVKWVKLKGIKQELIEDEYFMHELEKVPCGKLTETLYS